MVVSRCQVFFIYGANIKFGAINQRIELAGV